MKTENMIVGVTEASKYIGKTTTWVHKLMSRGILNPITPFRGKAVFNKKELDKYNDSKI